MGIFRGEGGSGETTTDAIASQVSVDSASASASATEAANRTVLNSTSAFNSATAASTSATSAAISVSQASSHATSAGISATLANSAKIAAEAAQTAAETAETNAETAESNAATSATNASDSASAASTSASNASTSASNASTSASNAATSATSAQSALTSINAFYLGTATSNPTVDGNGDAVTAGDWYFNTSDNTTRIYNGSTWNNIETSVVGDTTPQLGGDLDLNSNDITGTGNLNITGNISLSGTVDGRDLQTDGNKLDLIEAEADVTDATNVQAAGALMDSEVTNLAQVKAFDSSDYATAAQGSTADSALQNVVEDTTPQLGGNLDLNSNDITGTGNINITGTLQTSSNAIIGGNLTVSGTTTSVNTETINLADNNIVLNSNHTGAPTENAGITVERGTEADKVFQWNETTDLWETDDNFNVNGNITVTGTVDGRDLATDGTKLDLIEAEADVTDATNVQAAGALMDSEVTNLAQVKAFDSSDYATAAQGTTADSALQNVVEDTTPQLGGDLASNGNDVVFADNDKAIFGADSDLQIYHAGTNSIINDSGTGDLRIGGSTNVQIWNSATSKLSGNFNGDGAATLYNNGGAKLATTATGIDVTGDATFADNGKAIFGTGSDLEIYHDGSNSYITDAGTGDLRIRGANVEIQTGGGNKYFQGAANVASLYHTNNLKLSTTATGIDVTGTAVTDGLTVAGNLDVDSGTIKLDGNFPTGISNVALGNNAGSVIEAGAQHNVLVGNDTGDAVTTGDNNTLIGSGAGGDISTASHNVNIGYLAGAGSNEASTVIIGADAASASTGPGFGSVGIGYQSMRNAEISAYRNVGVGYRTFLSLSTGDNNVAIGYQASYSTNTGDNIAIGAYCLDGTDGGSGKNVAIGAYAMTSNLTTGCFANVALGYRAGNQITSGNDNVLIGYDAGDQITTGSDNIAIGYQALDNINTENYNVAIGHSALGGATSSNYSTAVGYRAGLLISTGSHNTILGSYTGNQGGLDIRTLSNRIVITDGGGNIGMYVDNSQDAHFDGNVIAYSTTISDRRLKSDITNISNALDKVGQINGVTFVRDHNGEKAAGVVAQEIMEVLPEAVKSQALPLQTGDHEEEYYVVEYDAVTGLLVEAVKELKARVEALESK
jgi:hypothetical protein